MSRSAGDASICAAGAWPVPPHTDSRVVVSEPRQITVAGSFEGSLWSVGSPSTRAGPDKALTVDGRRADDIHHVQLMAAAEAVFNRISGFRLRP